MSDTHFDVWWLKNGKLGVGKLQGSTITSYNTATSVFRLHARIKPTPFTTTLSAVPNFPSQFHMAPVAFVMETLAARHKEWETARYWRGRWKKLIRKAKIHKNKSKDGTAYEIKSYEL